ncbi:MAG: ankyrin repeat domain-containing protein, partial [Bacteroidota bacterium]
FARPAHAQAPPSPERVVELAVRGQTDAVLAALDAGADPNRAAPIEESLRDPLTPLMAAAWRNRTETVRALLAAGADVMQTDPNGNTALRWAADGRATEAARVLLAAGVPLGVPNAEGTTPSGWAAFVGAADVLALLLDVGADPETRDASGRTLLHRAIKTYGESYGGIETVAVLLARGADPTARTTDGSTPLHRAASDTPGAFAVSALLLEAGADPAARDRNGRTPSDLAMQRGGLQLAALYGGDAAARAQAALAVAIVRGDPVALREALAAGADPNAGVDGNTFFASSFIDDGGPLHLAALVGTPEVIAALVAGGAEAGAVTASGQPPLKVAADIGRLGAVEALLASGASPESTTTRPFLGMEPLHWAATGGHAEIVRVLLAAGASPTITTNATMGYGYNALGFAIHHGHTEAVRVLLDAGMETDHVGDAPTSALSLAMDRGWPEIEAVLRERGAKTDAELNAERIQRIVAESGPEAAWNAVLSDGDLQTLRLLLADGHPPPATALRRAIYSLQDDLDLVGALVSAGADVDAAGIGGNTALHDTAADGLVGLVAALLGAGADPGVENEQGQTPLDLAREWGDEDLIALFPSSTE